MLMGTIWGSIVKMVAILKGLWHNKEKLVNFATIIFIIEGEIFLDVKKITIYDIAKACECSPATVSLALKDDKRVAEKTRELVHSTAKKLKYQPSYFGRSLITGKANAIKVVIPDVHNPLFVNLLDGIEQYINRTEYHVVLDVTYNSMERELNSFESLLNKTVDGIIISPIYEREVSEYILRRGIDTQKIIYVGTECRASEKVHYCTTDSRKGAYLGVSNMLKNGCKKVAFLAPVVVEEQGRRRKEGYIEALEAFGFSKKSGIIVNCSQEFSDIYQQTVRLVQEQKADGIFCLYDYAAIPAMKAIADLGLSVPEDVMVSGYDNIDIGEFLDRPLTTVDPHQREQGYYSAETLLALLRGEQCLMHKVVEPTVIERETTRKR